MAWERRSGHWMNRIWLERGRRELVGRILLDRIWVIRSDIRSRRGHGARVILLWVRKHARRPVATRREISARNVPCNVRWRQIAYASALWATIKGRSLCVIRIRNWRRKRILERLGRVVLSRGIVAQEVDERWVRRVRLWQALRRSVRRVSTCTNISNAKLHSTNLAPFSSKAFTMSVWPFLTASMSGVTPA